MFINIFLYGFMWDKIYPLSKILIFYMQQFLRDHYKPTLSCYDEMVKEKIEMEKLKKHDLEVKEFEEVG